MKDNIMINEVHEASVDASELIIKKFHEIFRTETMSRIDSGMMFTLVSGVNRCGNPLISLYTIDTIGTKTPYRYTTIQWDVLENGVVHLGLSDSMTVECRELANFIESICEKFYYRDHLKRVERYTTRGN